MAMSGLSNEDKSKRLVAGLGLLNGATGMTTFHYFSGEVVMVGDRVRESGRVGRVLHIFQPGPESAEHYHCPDGAVSTSNRHLWEPPDGEFWEDLEFLGRRERWRFWV